MLLLTSVLLLTLLLVLILDHWASKRANEIIEEQKAQITEAFNSGFGDLMQAQTLANESLNNEEFMYESTKPEDLPQTVEKIIVAEESGKVRDSTRSELVGRTIWVPKKEKDQDPKYVELSQDPIHQETEDHAHAPKTSYTPITTNQGLFWIIIVTTRQSIINKIEEASTVLTSRTQQLSNYRLWATTGLLGMALAIAVVIGWRFTQPVQELAAAARRVTAGDLEFRIGLTRRDEVGQLANTFNEMIAGLKSKRELEEKLTQSERAAVIGRLTQSVAHEIRNPLNVINLSIDHASKRYAPEDETKRKQFTGILSSIKDEIARLNRMVNDLLNYGRPARLAVQSIDMRELVEETVALVRAQADEQGVDVVIEEDAPARVQGDRERLKSCLSNIAINALQAMPAGGHLKARIQRQDGQVEVSISDTGVGISKDALAKIFDAYYSTKQTGFGLGLAVTKQIIEEHRGAIVVTSELDEGTTFTMKLPAAS